MSEIVAVALAGGRGLRARPLTLKTDSYLRSKALIPFLGRRILEWSLYVLREQGIKRLYVVAQGKENREQIRSLIDLAGDRFGIEVFFSRTRLDKHNTGSGAAAIHNFDHWNLGGRALVFPVDSVFDFDLEALVEFHDRNEAVVTVATVTRDAADIAYKYGVPVVDETGRVQRFVEKPSPSVLADLLAEQERNGVTTVGAGQLPTNAGLYLVDCAALRLAAHDPGLAQLARQRLDWGGDLLPWLVSNGHVVMSAPIRAMGDLGSVRDYLITMQEVLAGQYPWMSRTFGETVPSLTRCWIHESSLRAKDEITGLTLEEKLRHGLVHIGPNVRIGRGVEIGTGVHISDADIGDDVDLGSHCRIEGTAIRNASIVGEGALLRNSYLGSMVEIHSTLDRPTMIVDFSALGDEVTVFHGARLSSVAVPPRTRVPGGGPLFGGTPTDWT